MRTGLVLGGGGVVGASWLIGALEALSEAGWDPRSADRIVGTSAGAFLGSLLADGFPPAAMAAYVRGGSLDELADLGDRAEGMAPGRSPDAYRLELSFPLIGPGSWRLAVATALRPRRHSPATLLSGWLPCGFLSTRPISELVGRLVTGAWPGHASFWAVATDYRDARRVAFGRAGAPRADIEQAVAASCAIPGFYAPVRIAGRRYVDGGLVSPANLDLLAGQGLDVVVCLNPTSALPPGRSPAAHVTRLFRTGLRSRLAQEARRLREEGTRVILLQPGADVVPTMGPNFMARDRRVQVLDQAAASVRRELRARTAELRDLVETAAAA